ncbi:TPA_exp: SET domain protein [Trichophyton benhamiae CBS 112371]|uniref:SET domain protein n=1 Tax=Arthroderma benhamiae (strain ATCC MYA-4681 / CBS 112371) TaxID=663331 RepID=D4ARC2_ARTBC|nr:SET domain protein [Trichophyton benhamiae CBS 112371]EFE34265.1 SET domain protein [Trichophyton benhamiae CBS 112371]DAA77219.1 TPA_exp: SET domain protein [Trichophyton benhamiae CBS 112371]
MAEPPAKDGLETPNILKKLKAERKQHSYRDLLSKWGIPINESEPDIAKHLVSKIFEGMAKNVSLQHTGKAQGSSFEQNYLNSQRCVQVQALVDMLLPIASGSIENDPSISTPLKDRYESHPIPWCYCSDPWDHGTLLMRNRWYNLYEGIPDLEYMLMLVQADHFREMLWYLEPKHWDYMVASLRQYSTSIKVFAEVIHLDFRWPFTTRARQLPMELAYGYFKEKRLSDYHPHTIVVNDSKEEIYGVAGWFRHTEFYKILHSLASIDRALSNEANKNPPPFCMINYSIADEWACISCLKRKHLCLCEYSGGKDKLFFRSSFLQLMDCNDGRGTGVRSLIRISEGVNLGTLRGKLRDPDPIGCPLTLISGEMRGVITKVNKHDSGNWTRFLNHSCDPNSSVIFGIYQGIPTATIVTTKCIQPMQEVTIDYGKKYIDTVFWICLCKSPTCRYSNDDDEDEEDDESLFSVTKGSPIEYHCGKEGV